MLDEFQWTEGQKLVKRERYTMIVLEIDIRQHRVEIP